MQNKKNVLVRSLLDVMAHSRVYLPFEKYTSGVGIIFTLHRIVDSEVEDFSPNSILQITPAFLDSVIRQVFALGYDIVTLDELKKRLTEKRFDRKFVCFTIDDGYADNLTQALPVFQRHNAPFTVYINSGMLEATTVLWWQHLEDIIKANSLFSISLSGNTLTFDTTTAAEKHTAFSKVYWELRGMEISEQTNTINNLLNHYNISSNVLCNKLSLTWCQVKELSDSGLVTIGGHTLNHYPLAKLSAEKAHYEIEKGQEILERKTGVRAKHFAYPFGDPGTTTKREFSIAHDLSFDTAVTQRKGVIFPEHKEHLHALPRVSLNGDFQNPAYVRVFLSGLPFSIANKFKKLDVA